MWTRSYLNIQVPRKSHSDWRSGESIIAETNGVPPAVTDNYGAAYDTCLKGEQCLSGAISNRYSWFPLNTNKDPRCCMQPAAIMLSPAKAAIIYFHKFATLPPPTTIKISCKEQIKVKYIALQQNCDQSDSLVVKTEFHTKLESRRMAPYLEQEQGQ